MAIVPVVRYMLLCEDWMTDPLDPLRVTIIGLLNSIRAVDQPPYPLVCEELCVFLALTDGRGHGQGQIVCVFEDDGRPMFATPKRILEFGSNPLEVRMFGFR